MTQGEHLMRARLYDLAAGLYLQEPTTESVAVLVSLADVIGALLEDETLSRLLTQAGEVPLPALRQEYYDLFAVPVSGRYLPPFESAQRENRLWGPLTHEVQALYQGAGFRPDELAISPCWNEMTLPDHIGFELAFVSGLLRSLADVETEMEEETLQATTTQFVAQHVARWMPDFGRKVRRSAQTPFYQAVGLMTEHLPGL